MKQRKLHVRILSCLIAMIVSISAAFAQVATVKHIVARGETLKDIAKSYNTTKEEIISLNPDAAQFVYVGMELTIPQKTQAANTTGNSDLNSIPNTVNQYDSPTIAHDSSNGPVVGSGSESSATSLDDDGGFFYWGIGYQASFETADKGSYGIFFRGVASYHFGMDFGAFANYGIVDKDWAGIGFLIGPAVGNKYGNVLASVALDAAISSVGTVEDGKKDTKTVWGIALVPEIAVDLNGLKLLVGLNVGWTKGADELGFGFRAGIAF